MNRKNIIVVASILIFIALGVFVFNQIRVEQPIEDNQEVEDLDEDVEEDYVDEELQEDFVARGEAEEDEDRIDEGLFVDAEIDEEGWEKEEYEAGKDDYIRVKNKSEKDVEILTADGGQPIRIQSGDGFIVPVSDFLDRMEEEQDFFYIQLLEPREHITIKIK